MCSPKAGIGPQRVDTAANDDGRVEAAGGEDRGNHGRGCGFAVHAGDGDAVFEPHELGQHFSAGNDLDFVGVGFDDFRIACRDGGAGDDHGSACNIGGVVALIDGSAELGEAVGNRAAAQVGAGDLHPHAEKDLGNAAHADAADTDEVRVLGGCEHAGGDIQG